MMKPGLLRSRWAAVGAAVAVTLGGGTVWVASAATPTAPTSFVATDPTRVLDTREPSSPIKTLGFGSNVTLSLASVVPADALAVSLNVTVVNGTGSSFLVVYPTGTTKPTASNINWADSQAHGNAVNVKLGTNSSIDIFNLNGTVDVIVDVSGFYVPGGAGSQGPPGPPGPKGDPGSPGFAPPTLVTDDLEYVVGAGNVNFAGAGWDACDTIDQIDVFGPLGFTAGQDVAPTLGRFTGSFEIPNFPGSYLLVAQGSPQSAACNNAIAVFTVVPTLSRG